jgi:hypothetical protein
MRPLTYGSRIWGLASHIFKKTPSSTILHSTRPSAVSISSPPLSFYHTASQESQPASTLELNDELVNLVKHARYDEAYRLRNHLFEKNIPIHHHLVYEKAALAGVDLGRNDEGLNKFVIWFSLVPDRNELPPCLQTQRQYVYSNTRFALLRSGVPKAYMRYIMVFGNIMAAKGYLLVSFLDIARVVVRFGKKELVPQYFEELEKAAAYYYSQQEPEQGGWVLKWFWEVIVKLYVEKRWLDLAFQTAVEREKEFLLSDGLRKIVLKSLEASEARKDKQRLSVLQKLWAKDKKASI